MQCVVRPRGSETIWSGDERNWGFAMFLAETDRAARGQAGARVFISYRADDGRELAAWVHDGLKHRTISLTIGGIVVRTSVSSFLHESAPAANDWRMRNESVLEAADALI